MKTVPQQKRECGIATLVVLLMLSLLVALLAASHTTLEETRRGLRNLDMQQQEHLEGNATGAEGE